MASFYYPSFFADRVSCNYDACSNLRIMMQTEGRSISTLYVYAVIYLCLYTFIVFLTDRQGGRPHPRQPPHIPHPFPPPDVRRGIRQLHTSRV
jgi:hypothetical protein